MTRKFFPLDKNYLLKEAQLSSREFFISQMIERVKANYLSFYNPLGLEDDTVRRIKQAAQYPLEHLEEVYETLCAIYRYQHGDNQLEFLWDGTSHLDKYQTDWGATLNRWVDQFCYCPHFIKAVFEISIFWHDGIRPQLAQNRLKTFIYQQFELKIYRYKGIRHFSA